MRRIQQITRSVSPKWVGNEYASVDCVSPDGALILAIAVDHFILLSRSGAFVKDLKIGASEEPRWMDARHVQFIRGNSLFLMDVDTEAITHIRTFPEYSVVSGKGEEDSGGSSGDRCIVLCGDSQGVFVYNLTTGVRGPVLVKPESFNSLYMTPDNNVLLSDADGVHLFNQNMWFIRTVAPHNGHKDVCRDADGSEIMVWTDNEDNCVYKIPLNGRPRTRLLRVPWPSAVNISCPAKGFAIVSTYSLDPQYPGQVLMVALDGSGHDVLFDTESVMIQKPAGGMAYNPQPKASVSADGTLIVGSSNFGETADPNYCDVFIAEVSGTAPPAETRIDYAPYVGKTEFVVKPRLDGAVDIFERQIR